MSTLIKQKNGTWVQVAGGTRMWTGTRAQLAAALAAKEIPDHTQVMVTDDYETSYAVPVGVVEAYFGKTAPKGWLMCDGSTFSKDVYPELYEVLGSETLPDLRESALVGAGTRAKGVADHDVYTVGQFKDDQVQNHRHYRYNNDTNGWNRGVELGDNFTFMQFSDEYENGGPVGHINNDPAYRKGTTTHGKQTGVNFIIYAGV